ncbi:hypothetical protein [Mycolicibacterium sphagni]|uniref:Uncharacterized protein n=1 Tax=Mycolicibacterium sphagni TaxID=1786 RepID=A0A255DHJ7_9MYCO|nr:hypothetical protein [Mycolicibacterium sphagni]OYN78949.1 hypothetical protein CG716_13875 [Mycolicibacterium sphagni]
MSVRIVVVVALAALITLLAAVLTDNTFVSVGVIALAVVGILLLARDWRSDRRHPGPAEPAIDEPPTEQPVDAAMSAEMFAPDISTEGPGPSSDARAD